MNKLLAFDLDGTILTEDGYLSHQFLQYIDLLDNKGYLVTFITGRNPSAIGHIGELKEIKLPISCSNGSVLFESASKRIIEKNTFEKEIIDQLYNISEKVDLECLEFQLTDRVFFPLKSKKWAKENLWYADSIGTYVEHEVYLSEIYNAVKFDVLGNELTVSKFIKELNGLSNKIELVKGSEKNAYEITPKGINKGYGLKRLTQMTGLDIDTSIVVGDGYNDVSMFQVAGKSYAMSQAPEEVKKHASVVSPIDSEESLVWIINHILDD